MSFLRRFRRPQEPRPDPDPDGRVRALLQVHGLQALDKQLHLQDLVGEADWLFDQDAGTITFGGEKAYPAQLLGTVVERTGSWLWAWANESVVASVSEDARALQRLGETNGVAAFVTAELSLSNDLPGEALALIASELVDADAYYRGPYDGGAAFILLRLPADAPRQVVGDGLRAVRTLSLAPLALPIPLEQPTIDRYLRWVGLELDSTPGRSIGRDRLGAEVTVTLDQAGRFASLESTVSPPPD